MHTRYSLIAASHVLVGMRAYCNDDVLFTRIRPSKDVYDITSSDVDMLHVRYDSHTRNPRWVMEHLHRNDMPAEATKRPLFYPENKIDHEIFRVCDYNSCHAIVMFLTGEPKHL